MRHIFASEEHQSLYSDLTRRLISVEFAITTLFPLHDPNSPFQLRGNLPMDQFRELVKAIMENPAGIDFLLQSGVSEEEITAAGNRSSLTDACRQHEEEEFTKLPAKIFCRHAPKEEEEGLQRRRRNVHRWHRFK